MRYMKQTRTLVLAVILLQGVLPLMAQSAAVKTTPYKRDPSEAALKWANQELSKMSLEQKIGQLISVGINDPIRPQSSKLPAFETPSTCGVSGLSKSS